jgi:hypothetical protein
MSKQELSDGVWYDPEGTGYIMLDTTAVIPPQEPRMIDGVRLLPKDEYHCSLVAARKLADGDRDLEARIVKDTVEYLRTHTVGFVGMTGNYYLCQKTNDDGEIEKTIIGGVEIRGIEGLRAILRRRTPEYQPPFPHVTLLKSANSLYGIGVNSEESLRAYCTRLENYN